MKIDDGAGGSRWHEASDERQEQPESKKTRPAGHGEPVIRRADDDMPGIAGDVSRQGLGNFAATHCRYCGSDEQQDDSLAERTGAHYQVVVACGSCGHAFAALSRN
jgi:hypothetical protein